MQHATHNTTRRIIMSTSIQQYDTPTDPNVLETIRGIISETLVIDISVVHANSTIFDELDSESIDMLDFLFRIDQKLGIKIQAGELASLIQGGIPDEEFGDADGIVNERGLSQLKKTMPQLDTDALKGILRAEEIMDYFTVENFANVVSKLKIES
jgi:acyl carrier protein